MREQGAPTSADVGHEIVLLAQALRAAEGYEFRAPKRPEPSPGGRPQGEVSDSASRTALDERRLKVRGAVRQSYVTVRAARRSVERAVREFEAADE